MFEELRQGEGLACFPDVMCYVHVLDAHTEHGVNWKVIVMNNCKVNYQGIEVRVDKNVVPPRGNPGVCREASGLAVRSPPTMGLGPKVLPAVLIDENHELSYMTDEPSKCHITQ